MVELGICSNEGKGNSELGLLRKLWNILKPGDVLLTDRYMCAWTELVMLKQRGVDSVTRLHHLRRIDFRRGKHLGPGDHIIAWPKPRKPHSIDQEIRSQVKPRHEIKRDSLKRLKEHSVPFEGVS